ncbi:hypothetical protein HWV62_39295 [Athelia sp. TMB]|nr:hypothetical protein HWV62_39295 [Athelia sp. TMB]
MVRVNPKSDFAKLFGLGGNISTIGDIISTTKERLQVMTTTNTYYEPAMLIHQSLAPSLGKESNLGSLKFMDGELKTYIGIATRSLLKIKEGGTELDWNTVQGCFNNQPCAVLIEPSSNFDDTFEYTNKRMFNFNGSPEPGKIEEVKRWWDKSLRSVDDDIPSDTKIDIDMLALIVARSGAVVKNLLTAIKSQE